MSKRKTKSVRSIVDVGETKLTRGEIFLEIVRMIITLIGKIIPWFFIYKIADALAGKITVINSDFLGQVIEKYAPTFEALEKFVKNVQTFIIILLSIVLILLFFWNLYQGWDRKNKNGIIDKLKQEIGKLQEKGV